MSGLLHDRVLCSTEKLRHVHVCVISVTVSVTSFFFAKVRVSYSYQRKNTCCSTTAGLNCSAQYISSIVWKRALFSFIGGSRRTAVRKIPLLVVITVNDPPNAVPGQVCEITASISDNSNRPRLSSRYFFTPPPCFLN